MKKGNKKVAKFTRFEKLTLLLSVTSLLVSILSNVIIILLMIRG